MPKPYRVAYLVSHPFHFQAPLLRAIAAQPGIDLTVFFESDLSLHTFTDPGFGAPVAWGVPLLEGYPSVFLPAWGRTDRLSFWQPVTHGLRRRLKAGEFDALWVHSYARFANLRAMLLARSLGLALFYRNDSQIEGGTRHPLKRWARDQFLRRLFGRVDAFLAIGARNGEYYRHNGVPAEKIFPMPYVVDNARLQAEGSAARDGREALRAGLGLAPGRPIILYAGKFLPRKRVGDLLDAYRRLSPDGRAEPAPYLLLVGDGAERARLEDAACGQGWGSVRFLGFKNQRDLLPFYDLCDVFVLPSEREPWGLVVNEVMNLGKPVIVSNQVGAGADLVRDGINGRIFPAGDAAALAECLCDILCEPDAARRMGQASLRLINDWGHAQAVAGLEKALAATIRNNHG